MKRRANADSLDLETDAHRRKKIPKKKENVQSAKLFKGKFQIRLQSLTKNRISSERIVAFS